MIIGPSRRKVLHFCYSENAAVVVETVLWLPFVFLLSIAVSTTFFIYMNYAQAVLALESETRKLAVGSTANCAALETRLEARLAPRFPSVDAQCSVTGFRASTNLAISAEDMGLGVLRGFVDGFTLTAANTRSFEHMGGS